jgi:hypothetical protein
MIIGAVGGRAGRRLMQQLTSGGHLGLAAGVGEQAVVTDAMEPRGEDSANNAIATLTKDAARRRLCT